MPFETQKRGGSSLFYKDLVAKKITFNPGKFLSKSLVNDYFVIANIQDLKLGRGRTEKRQKSILKYDDVMSDRLCFDMPPIKFEDHKSSDSSKKSDSESEPDLTPPRRESKSEEKYKGWKHLSDVILSNNMQKINFIKNWRNIYDKTHKKGKFYISG